MQPYRNEYTFKVNKRHEERNEDVPMVAAALEARGRVVAATRLAELRHDVALVDGFGLVGHRVDVLARLFPAQCHVFLVSQIRVLITSSSNNQLTLLTRFVLISATSVNLHRDLPPM